MNIQTRLIEYEHNGTLLEAFLAWDGDNQAPKPAVMIAHMWAGRVPFTENKAVEMAKLGYVGFALDMYGKGVIGDGKEECQALMEKQTDDRKSLQVRMLKALEVVKQQPEVDENQVAAIGYCFGGLCVLDLARTGVEMAGIASFHALLGAPDHNTESINTPLLVMHGHDDPMAPPSDVSALQKELSEAGADWQLHEFGGAMHAFTNPLANDVDFGTVYDELSDKRSWKMLLDFLEEVFE